MNSKNKALAVIGIVFVLAIGAVITYALLQSQDNDTTDTEKSPSQSSTHTEHKNDSTETPDAEQTNEVAITNYAYTPSSIEVKVGTTVTWTNQDTVEHTVTTEDGAPVSFDSDLFAKGESFSFTFEEAGEYNYICTPHPYMKGTVIVTE